MSKKLSRKDLNLKCEELAKFLLGKLMVRVLEDGTKIKAKIVETECYPGGDDKASMSYGNKKTPRNEPMFMKEGTCFVYLTYGMYHLINISSTEPGAAVLIRALEPIEGMETMLKFRTKKSKKKIAEHDLCSGPAKLCMSLNIDKDRFNKLDLCENNLMWLECGDSNEDFRIVTSTRIGIDKAGLEWASKPLRFYIFNNKCVSKQDKQAEAKFNST